MPALLVCAAAFAGCGGTGKDSGDGGGGCEVPGLNRLCPVELPGPGLPSIGAPSIQSFTVSPAEIRPGEALTIAATFTGSGQVVFVGLSGWIDVTTGTPVTAVPSIAPGRIEQAVELRVWGLVEDSLGGWGPRR
jgi:hypothetical protein